MRFVLRAHVLAAAMLGLLALQSHAQPNAVKRVGYFSAGSAATNAPRLAAFRRGMSELGWRDGRDYIIDARYAETAGANIPQLAADVVASRPDVILTPGDEAIRALAKATTTIPIVFAAATDPVALGVAKSLQRPGANATGLVTLRGPLGAKRIQLLKDAFPEITHVAALMQSGDAATAPQLKDIEAAAQRLGMRVSVFQVMGVSEIDSTVKRAARSGCQGFVVIDGFLFNSQRTRIAQAIAASGRPAIFPSTPYVEAGGLMSYGASVVDNFRRSAAYIDKILKGAEPGELAIDQPAKFDWVINLQAAKKISITFAPSLLMRADRVIE
jgi:putative ABC transport system substrate-binding protein